MKPFDTLNQAIDLYEKGRVNAGRELYRSLPKEFQRKLMELCIFRYNHRVKEEMMFESKYGCFVLSEFWLDAIQNLIEVTNEVI